MHVIFWQGWKCSGWWVVPAREHQGLGTQGLLGLVALEWFIVGAASLAADV